MRVRGMSLACVLMLAFAWMAWWGVWWTRGEWCGFSEPLPTRSGSPMAGLSTRQSSSVLFPPSSAPPSLPRQRRSFTLAHSSFTRAHSWGRRLVPGGVGSSRRLRPSKHRRSCPWHEISTPSKRGSAHFVLCRRTAGAHAYVVVSSCHRPQGLYSKSAALASDEVGALALGPQPGRCQRRGSRPIVGRPPSGEVSTRLAHRAGREQLHSKCHSAVYA